MSEGRVEVRLRDSWGTICDDHWTLREANVVCRSLGYGSAAIAAKNAYFGRGIGQVKRSSVERCIFTRKESCNLVWNRLTKKIKSKLEKS